MIHIYYCKKCKRKIVSTHPKIFKKKYHKDITEFIDDYTRKKVNCNGVLKKCTY